MPRKTDKNPAKPCQIAPKLPFAAEPYHDLLTPTQERALIALLEARSVAAAARQAGVPERTLRRWLRADKDFQNELRHLRQEALAHAASRLQQSASVAADALFTLLDSKDHIEVARAALVRTALDFAFRSGSYADLTDRIWFAEDHPPDTPPDGTGSYCRSDVSRCCSCACGDRRGTPGVVAIGRLA